MSVVTYRAPAPDDGPALATMARTSFAATFRDKFAPDDLAAYLDSAYGPDGQMPRDLAATDVDWLVAFANGAPFGYIKVSAMTLPCAARAGAMEVRQLYVAEEAKGKGVAAALMAWAIALAEARRAPEMFLAVFDDNAHATRFYARHGFEKIASFDFHTGDSVHDDGIWRRSL